MPNTLSKIKEMNTLHFLGIISKILHTEELKLRITLCKFLEKDKSFSGVLK